MKKRSDGWVAKAACRGLDPALFFPLVEDVTWDMQPGDIVDLTYHVLPEKARKVVVQQAGEWPDLPTAAKLCDKCTVRNNCLDYVLSLPAKEEGFWAGTTPGMRRRVRPMLAQVDLEADYGEGISAVTETLAAFDVVCP